MVKPLIFATRIPGHVPTTVLDSHVALEDVLCYEGCEEHIT